MAQITIATYVEDTAEATTPEFIKAIIPRIFAVILSRGNNYIENIEIVSIFNFIPDENVEDGTGWFINIYEKTRGYNFLIIHRDADYRDESRALRYHFEPFFNYLSEESLLEVGVVPLIPIRMIESWLCVDWNVFRDITYCKAGRDYGLFPNNPARVQTINDPKLKLNDFLRRCSRTRRGREVKLSKIFAPLGAKIDIQRLSRVPSFARFAGRLESELRVMHLIN